MADAPVEEKSPQPVEQVRLTFRRLVGLDRSGPPPPQTLGDQPWNVWTIPNAIGFVRLALIPVFLVLALGSESGTDALPAVLFAVISWSDYFDGIAARVTGQYSRFGALLDPFVDRLLVISGLFVCWNFELLPRWAIAVLVGRELLLLVFGQLGLRRGLQLKINWPGRLAVWPTMSAIFFALVGLSTLAEVLLYIGLVLAYYAVVLYVRDALAHCRYAAPPAETACATPASSRCAASCVVIALQRPSRLRTVADDGSSARPAAWRSYASTDGISPSSATTARSACQQASSVQRRLRARVGVLSGSMPAARSACVQPPIRFRMVGRLG